MTAVLEWLSSSDMWSGPGGIPTRLGEHLAYAGFSLALAALLALPLGVLTGHTGHGGVAAAAVSNYWRAVPTLGVVVLVFQIDPLSIWPVVAALVVIAVPPILLNTDAGLRGVDTAVRDAARGMGMTTRQSLLRVELPLAAPLILTGLRSGAGQVIATATIAAFVGLGGLGRYIIDGYAARDLPQVTGGAVLIATAALLVDALFAAVQAALSSNPHARRRRPRLRAPLPHLLEPVRHRTET